MSGPEPVRRLEELLERLESARVELEQTDDADRAVAILQELAELAKEVQTEVERARREPDAQG
jgi:exonuclease VII small subunit